MTLDELCQEVLELDEKATKEPWQEDPRPGGDYTYIKSSFVKAPFANENECWNKIAILDHDSTHLQEHQIIAIVDRDNLNLPDRLVPWGDQQDLNRKLIVNYRTSAPLLAKACQRMKEALEHLEEHHWFEDKPGVACMGCDMGDSGYSTKGDGHHDNRESRYCAVLKCHEALADVDALLKGEK